jgi:hypothetical protein
VVAGSATELPRANSTSPRAPHTAPSSYDVKSLRSRTQVTSWSHPHIVPVSTNSTDLSLTPVLLSSISSTMHGLSPLHAHWYYVWIPLLTASVWVGTLLAMLITWLAQGRPKYPTMTGKIAYMSDIGADILKPLFIVGCCITAAGFIITLIVERWLRHEARCGFRILLPLWFHCADSCFGLDSRLTCACGRKYAPRLPSSAPWLLVLA